MPPKSLPLLTALLLGCDDPAADPGRVECPDETGEVITHTDTVTADETWAGDGTVHEVPYDTTIYAPATLTLEACAIVEFAPNVGLAIRGDTTGAGDARLVSAGEEGRPVLLRERDEGQPWGTIRGYNERSLLDLRYTDLHAGGGGGASLWLAGGNDWSNPDPTLSVDHVSIVGSATHGVLLDSAAFSEGSTDLTITESGSDTYPQPIALGIRALESVPTGSYEGNLSDEILVHLSLDIGADETFPNRGVPIHFEGGRVYVASGSGADADVVLTVEAGLELRFDGALIIGGGADEDADATLIAEGGSDPIVFTSAEASPAPGDWPGIWLRSAAGSRLQNVVIAYAGGGSGVVSSNCKPAGTSDDAALIIGNFSPDYVPDTTVFEGSVVDQSAGHAINPVWESTSFGPNLTAGNTLASYGGCGQTKNIGTNGCGGEEGCLVD